MNFIKPRDPELVRPLQAIQSQAYAWIPEFRTFLRRHWNLILGCLVACLSLGVAALVFLPQNFTASAQVLFDSRRADPFHQQNTTTDAQTIDGLVESQVEILRSDGLARKVVERLNLVDDRDFLALGHSLRTEIEEPFRALLKRLQGVQRSAVDDKLERAVTILTNLTTVRRVGLTYVLDVDVRAHDPEMAAKLANGITAAYIAAQMNAKYEVTHTASDWLRSRSDDLRQDALTADRAVQDFKAKNNIVDTDKGLLNEQELAELNSSLVAAHSEVSSISARHKVDPYRNDLQIARDNEKNIQNRINQLVHEAASTNGQRVVLRALESSADTYRSLYENFLQRYSQAVQEQSFPVSEAQVVTAAAAPLTASSPRPIIVMPISAVLGLGLGFALAFLRESTERGLRTAAELRLATGLSCIGLLPQLRRRDLRIRPGRMVGIDGGPAPHLLRAPRTGLRYAIERPRSQFALTIGAIVSRLIHLQFASPNRKVVGCISTLPGEGSSTIAANLAQLLARRGQRTILIDGNPGVSSLTALLARGSTVGLPDILAGNAKLADVLVRDEQTGLQFLPAGRGRYAPTLAEMLSSMKLGPLLGELRASYDHIVFDLPPLTPVADTQMLGTVVDTCILAIAWGHTEKGVLTEGLTNADFDELRPLGAIFNKVDVKAIKDATTRI